jgi:putative two-component system response regulator
MVAASITHESGSEPDIQVLLGQAREIESTDIGRARSLVQQARVISRSRQDRVGESEALYRLAELSYASGLTNEAFAVALESRDLAHHCGSAKTEVSALNLIAAVQYNAANFSEALASALAALDLYRSTGEKASEGMLLNSLAVIQHSLSDTDRAIVTYEAALMANKGQERPDLDAITLANMAKVRADRNEELLAVSLGESALELAKLHAPEFIPEILARLALAFVALAALDRATVCLDEADGVLRDRTARRVALSPGSVVTVRVARGELYVAMHLRDHALREWATALDLATEANMTEIALTLREKLANLNKEMGRYEQALMHQEERYALNEEIFNRGTDLRLTTLQIQHEAESARQQAEILRLRTAELDSMVQLRLDDVESFHVSVLQRIAMMAETYKADVSEHPLRVGELAAAIAEEMDGAPEFVHQIGLAARLHDIGKVAIPQAVLLKPGPLTVAEFEVMKTHTTRGSEMVGGSASPVMKLAEEIALTHHERWDGSGYPRGLADESIPISGRIVCVVDVYDSLTSESVYKHAWSAVDAVNHLLDGRGSRFDPAVVDAFMKVISRRIPSLALSLGLSTPE